MAEVKDKVTTVEVLKSIYDIIINKISNAISTHSHTVDSSLSSNSENPVQNKIVNNAITQINNNFNVLSNEVDDNYNELSNEINKNYKELHKLTRHNLLDNGNFSNPVNQKGLVYYTGYLNTSIDRWCLTDNTTLSVHDGYISCTYGSMIQNIMPNKLSIGKKYTQVIKLYNGDIYMNVFEINDDGSVNSQKCDILDLGSIRMSSYSESDEIKRYVYVINVDSGKIMNIEWAALYNGECTIDTLPDYKSKDFSTEYLECCRYFYRIPSTFECPYSAYNCSDGNCYAKIILPVKMINIPTLYVENINMCKVYNSSFQEIRTITDIQISNMNNNAASLIISGVFMTDLSSSFVFDTEAYLSCEF